MRKKEIKLLVFDLDSTLAPIGKGMGEKELNPGNPLSQRGVRPRSHYRMYQRV